MVAVEATSAAVAWAAAWEEVATRARASLVRGRLGTVPSIGRVGGRTGTMGWWRRPAPSRESGDRATRASRAESADRSSSNSNRSDRLDEARKNIPDDRKDDLQDWKDDRKDTFEDRQDEREDYRDEYYHDQNEYYEDRYDYAVGVSLSALTLPIDDLHDDDGPVQRRHVLSVRIDLVQSHLFERFCQLCGRERSRRLLSSRGRVLKWLPSLLLVAVACHQIVLTRTQGLSPWAGGGFGMFSSADAGSTRHVHAFVQRPGLRREVDPPPELRDSLRRAMTLPSDTRLREIARVLEKMPTPDHGPASSLEVQVWQTHHRVADLAPGSRILRSLVVDTDED